MARTVLHLGVGFVIFSVGFGSAILPSSSDDYGMAAVVVFNSTDLETNVSEMLSSSGRDDDAMNYGYGRSSPKRKVSGLVQLAAEEDGHYYGCSKAYLNFNFKGSWIAFIERGQCSFSQKIKLARLANASGAIIFDYGNDFLFMSHEDESKIVAVSIPRDFAEWVISRIKSGNLVTVSIKPGHTYASPYGRGNKTSIIFVSLSFLILMIISLTWLIVYYVQRFRLVHTPDILKKRRAQARKIVSSLPKKLLQEGDKELTNEEICPICIETYKAEETLRILPCKHIFHRKCVDPWLRVRETCPMCKLDVMKSKGLMPSPYDANFIFGTRTPIVEVWEPDSVDIEPSSNSVDSLVPEEEYREATIIAVVEGENDQSSSVETTTPSSIDESPCPLQSPTEYPLNSFPGAVTPT